MLKRTTFILLLALTTIASAMGQKKEEKLVNKSFENYKDAILNDRGEEAAKFVDSRTINYYAHILDNVKHADSAEVDALGLLDKLMVLSIRHRAEKEEILGFTGESLLVYAIKEGMVGKNSVSGSTLGQVEIDGTFAKAPLVAYGEEAPFHFHFYKETDVWKIDLTALFTIAVSGFKKVIEDSEMGENEYLLMILEQLTGRKPGREVWDRVV